jgi:hypothetical protein
MKHTKLFFIGFFALTCMALQAGGGSFDELSKRKASKPKAKPKPQFNTQQPKVATTMSGSYVITSDLTVHDDLTVKSRLKAHGNTNVGTGSDRKYFTVYGESRLGPNHKIGQIDDFNPATTQLLITHDTQTSGAQPAIVNYCFVTTLTWGNISFVSYANNSIIAPDREGRSYLSTPTNWNSMSTSTNTLYGVDLTMTPSTRKTSNGAMALSPINSFGTIPYSSGTLFYEVMGENVSDISTTTTFAPSSVEDILATYTVDEIQAMISDWVAGLPSWEMKKSATEKLSKKELIDFVVKNMHLFEKQ